MEEQQEQSEAQGLQQIIELCQTGNPQALGQIAEIATAMLQAQGQEMQEEQAPESSFEEQLLAAQRAKEGGK
jgi:hypothetical protein